MKNDQKWVDHLMNRLEHVQKAQPSEAFLERMEQMAEAYIQVKEKVPRTTLYGIAASLLILIMVNGWMLNKAQDNLTESQPRIEAGNENAYDLIPTKSIYHD